MNVSLNLKTRGLPQSATLAINARSAALAAEGRQVFKLGLGQSPFPVPNPVVEALRVHAAEKAYLPVEGLPQLRRAVARFHRANDSVTIKPENVLIGPGSKELLFLVNLVFYGDLVVPTPCWVSYVPQAKIIGRGIRLIPTSFDSCWRVTAEQLDALCQSDNDDYRPRLVVLNYPGNPDGVTFSVEELEAIADVARRYHLLLLSDEIYGQLHHKGEHVSIARFYPEGTIISGGLSKWCGAGGWRLGTFAFPPELRWLMVAMAAVASETYTSVSAPIQYAAVHAFEGGLAIERYLWHARRLLATLGQRSAEILREAGVRVHSPTGAFYLFTDFSPLRDRLARRGITDDLTLCNVLLDETGVAILPGAAFQRQPEELTARLAYVDFDGAKALSASETVPIDEPLPNGFVEHWCGRVIEAMTRIAEWVQRE